MKQLPGKSHSRNQCSPRSHQRYEPKGYRKAKPFVSIIPMKTGIHRQRCWNSNEVGFPLQWMATKMKYDSSRRAINHPRVGERWGQGKCVGAAVRLD
ncbi:hypothetical protein AVEN_140950-1 [Araneus ventricosus]|uniref:Uncharacterized protein n=1 Tax=Araneus ventricosus TaxID=182803 RepID=A0A4Y2GDS8_ARAVE|nr:hypothetical protein AVEN_140950-1 [Araneus ventricosus]